MQVYVEVSVILSRSSYRCIQHQ